MFYAETRDQKLRFGDVLKGYLSTVPSINEPFMKQIMSRYNIDVSLPNCCVVMDPCCQIGGGSLSLTPLIEITPTFWDNPYLAQDLTKINRNTVPKEVMQPTTWNELSDKDKLEMTNAPPQYNRINFFVYRENGAFPPYAVKREVKYEETIDPTSRLPIYSVKKENIEFQTNYYMINFKKIFHVLCKKIHRADKETDAEILESKILQLSIEARNELRDKLSFYYGNPPDEDRTDE